MSQLLLKQKADNLCEEAENILEGLKSSPKSWSGLMKTDWHNMMPAWNTVRNVVYFFKWWWDCCLVRALLLQVTVMFKTYLNKYSQTLNWCLSYTLEEHQGSRKQRKHTLHCSRTDMTYVSLYLKYWTVGTTVLLLRVSKHSRK